MAAEVKFPEFIDGLNNHGNPQPIFLINQHGILLDGGVTIEEVAIEMGRTIDAIPAQHRRSYIRFRHLVADNECGAQLCEFLGIYGVKVIRAHVRGEQVIALRCRRAKWRRTYAPMYFADGTRRKNRWRLVPEKASKKSAQIA